MPCWWCGTTAVADFRGYFLCSAACDAAYMSSYSTQPQVSYCQSCFSRSVVAGTGYCSKRCSWHATSRCPQCGRNRDVNYTYCSQSCASHALQANWCPSCGLRQIVPGLPHCGTSTCVDIAGAAVAALRRPMPMGREPSGYYRKEGLRTQQSWLAPDDKVRANVAAQIAPNVRSVIGVAKLCADNIRKKRYLGYRSCVEQSMFATKVPKYGHGGEGNEHRRFYPISFTCRHLVAQSFAKAEHVTCCDDKHCSACSIISYGFSKQLLGCNSHFSTSSPGPCLPYCSAFPMLLGNNNGHTSPFGANVAALVIARTVVGVPNIVTSLQGEPTCSDVELMHSLDSGFDSCTSGCSTAEQSPGQLSLSAGQFLPLSMSKAPAPFSLQGGVTGGVTHSTVCIHDDGTDEMLLDNDDAVDALFLVIVEL